MLLLGVGGWIILQPPPTPLNQADTLFAARHYHQAYERYQTLAARHRDTAPDDASPPPDDSADARLFLRLGVVHTLRGEYPTAQSMIQRSLAAGVAGEERTIALLYLHHLAHLQGENPKKIESFAPFEGVARVLAGEYHLQKHQYRDAEAEYRAGLMLPLPRSWQQFARYRFAFLTAIETPTIAYIALHEDFPLRSPYRSTAPTPDDPFAGWTIFRHTKRNDAIRSLEPFLLPLLPTVSGEVGQDDAGQLAAILAIEEPAYERLQLLGQFYLQRGHPALAIRSFAHIPAAAPNSQNVAAFTAYAQWRADNQRADGQFEAASLVALETIVERYPAVPALRSMLVLGYLQAGDTSSAQAHLEKLMLAAANDPNTSLAWAQWYLAQADYHHASEAYQQAIARAPATQRGKYALLAAQFYLDTGYGTCPLGLPAAHIAVDTLPTRADTWTALAAAAYACRDYMTVIEAAATAQLYGGGAESSYYQGMAFAALGRVETARTAFIRAINQEPASEWRGRAETQLEALAER